MAEFITVVDLKNNTVIQNNIEAKLLEPFISVAQDLHIKEIIGVALADALSADISINADGETEASTARFIALLPYVKAAHIYATAAEATPFLAVRITNKGINKRLSEFTQTASDTEVKQIQAKFHNLADFYKKELECFILDNETDYPEYRQEECDDCIPRKHRFFSGIQFEKTRKINPDYL